MQKKLAVWLLIEKSLQQKVEVMLMYVLESMGSSPGRQGFFMAVNAAGEMEGSLGGGIMEHKFVEMAKSKLVERNDESSMHKQIHDKSVAKNQSGMICSGEQIIFLYTIQPTDIIHIKNIIKSLLGNGNGTLEISPQGFSFSDEIPTDYYTFYFSNEKDWVYREKTGYHNQLYIIGGGHCALAFSKLMREMDFYIHLFDERDKLKTMLENDFVHVKQVIESYEQLSDLIPSGNNHYVVIMTFGYRTDDMALRALLEKSFKYLGMLGSQSKIDKMFEDYQKQGLSNKLLNGIFTPIGIQIKSQTPEEIAISIAAEIIKVKNADLK